MSKFDRTEVDAFVAQLDADMDRYDNGEGMGCADPEAALQNYAKLCRECRDELRNWSKAVFSGRVPPDPEIDEALLDIARKLHADASTVLNRSNAAENLCYRI